MLSAEDPVQSYRERSHEAALWDSGWCTHPLITETSSTQANLCDLASVWPKAADISV
jgi:hypothetical protein